MNSLSFIYQYKAKKNTPAYILGAAIYWEEPKSNSTFQHCNFAETNNYTYPLIPFVKLEYISFTEMFIRF